MTDDNKTELTRRTFVKGVGLAAGAAALGAGATGSGAAESGFETRFANPRVREAAKVWESKPWRPGFRGNPKRTLALNDSGIDLAHPDLGPWNGITAVGQDVEAGDGRPEIVLTTPDALESRAETREMVDEEMTQTAVLGPGTTVEGTETTYPPFVVPEGKGIVDMDASLEWTPQNADLPVTVIVSEAGEDQSFRVELNVGTEDAPEWVTLQTVDTGANPEVLSNVTVVPGSQHRFVAGQFANVAAEGTVTYSFHRYGGDLATKSAEDVFDFSGFETTPKTVGWFDSGARYGTNAAPTDPDSHGSHVSGIMTGSGRASTVDAVTREAPRAVLTAGDTLTYEVEAAAGTGVFGVATGEGIEVLIEGPTGQTLRVSENVPPLEEARVDHPTVDRRHPGTAGNRDSATYTVIVRPIAGEVVSTGRVDEVAVGTFADPDGAAGDRDGGSVSLHSGLAPDGGLVGIQGLSGPVATMGLYGDELTPLFNIRAMNMSWGGLVPGGGTVGGSSLERALKRVAESGVLPVAAAGNNFGTINGTPALADEVVSVAATDDLDGITSYSDGGAQAQDEDGESTYGKPDVCAPGGTLATGARSVRARSDGEPADVVGARDYVNFAGTSMASPYACGAVALIAQAMEEAAPASIRLPSPAELHAPGVTAEDRLAHVLRLKTVLLSTASSTAFTAAPYHKHAVTYRHDGRDTYEGFGRINPDAAVDALTRDLLPEGTENAVSGSVGLNVPEDSRAVAGYVEVPDGSLEVSLAHSHYGGGNKGMAEDVPWLDLFVYDAEEPGRAGEPNVLASAMGQQGSASVAVDVAAARDDQTTAADETETRTLFVVAKLVNVPGAVNGYDVQSHFDIDLSFTPSGPLPLPEFAATGSRSDDGSTFTQGQTNEVQVTVESFSDGVTEVSVTDAIPDGWTLLPYGDAATDERVEDPGTVDLGTVSRDDLGTGAATKRYFVEATGGTGQSDFGPAVAAVAAKESGVRFRDDERAAFAGTDTNTVVGLDQNAV